MQQKCTCFLWLLLVNLSYNRPGPHEQELCGRTPFGCQRLQQQSRYKAKRSTEAGLACSSGSARVGASRRLLVEEELLGDKQQRMLRDPNPVCQFCELAVSYVKVRARHSTGPVPVWGFFQVR